MPGSAIRLLSESDGHHQPRLGQPVLGDQEKKLSQALFVDRGSDQLISNFSAPGNEFRVENSNELSQPSTVRA
ncbi:hypothetical protein [Roseococcus sp. YIM B11640]|uniref:hypothetical protein n=1 Tax=Roseococcus sp. YIM B11640 TaxID=3133973 RepID=UPI003C7AE34E